jgi:4a-hydroxytetrahydrobiopterin dehydratase
MELAQKNCVPCDGKTPALSGNDVARLMVEVPTWKLSPDQRSLEKSYEYADFKQAMSFVNRMAALAEAEGHHPDFRVRWNRVDVTLSTHAIGGLSENDFILAAKIDRLTLRQQDQQAQP